MRGDLLHKDDWHRLSDLLNQEICQLQQSLTGVHLDAGDVVGEGKMKEDIEQLRRLRAKISNKLILHKIGAPDLYAFDVYRLSPTGEEWHLVAVCMATTGARALEVVFKDKMPVDSEVQETTSDRAFYRLGDGVNTFYYRIVTGDVEWRDNLDGGTE